VDRCAECGFVYADLPRDRIADALRSIAAQYHSRLCGTGLDALRRRPTPERWSALEYGAHVRDVLQVQRERAALALRGRSPVFEPMRRDERVTELAYNAQDPHIVDSELAHAAEVLAALFDGLGDSEWTRSGTFNWPTVSERDLVWLGRHTVHELAHHLLDINRSVQATPGSASG
jgi:DNA segregation ATPase FtsK/SpoIIIE, S-DNA-T family